MKKILILGAGFAGVRAALDLEKRLKHSVKITVVDKNPYHLFVPSLYEVASAYGVKADPFAVTLRKSICLPLKDIFAGKSIEFIEAAVNSIDTENRHVMTAGGMLLDYDYLVVGLGCIANDFGVPGVMDYAYKFKDIEDGLMLNRKVYELVNEIAGGQRRAPLKIAVVGAGFTGIEVAAELSGWVRNAGKACSMTSRCERITLLEAGPKMLPAVSEKDRKAIMDRLTRLGIVVKESMVVEEVGPDYVKLKNGQKVEADLVIWSAGLRANPVLVNFPSESIGVSKKLKANPDLSVVGLNNVYVIGDAGELLDQKTGKPVPALAYVAIDQGTVVAKNIYNKLHGKKVSSYKPEYSTWIAPVGGKWALANLGGKLRIKGFFGWVVREVVDLRYLLSILPFGKAISTFWQGTTLFIKND